MSTSSKKEMSNRQKNFVSHLGYDPGEWITDWVENAIDRPNLALPMGMVGPTGTGKTNFAWGVLWLCAQQGDCVLIPGDAACEFRHFLLYTKNHPTVKLKFIVPEEFEFEFFIGKSNEQSNLEQTLKGYKVEIVRYNIYEKSINDFIEPATILVIVDACFNLESKSWFWQYNLKQIKYRKRYHYIHVTYCFPEGSTYFPNTPFREQYKPVYIHSKDFVEYRKFFMRGIYLYHHSSMLFYLIEKQFETVIKKGSTYDARTPLDNRYGRGKAIHEYTIVHQGHEDIKLEIEGMFQEINDLWKIIPDKEIAFDIKRWDSDESEKGEKPEQIDEYELLIGYYKQIQKENPDWSKEDMVTELFLMNKSSSIRSVCAIAGIGERKAEKCKARALWETASTSEKIVGES
jgi:hypothetical protein